MLKSSTTLGLPIRRRNRSAPPKSRSEEHTSELQSRFDLVCRLLLEKKKSTRTKTSGSRQMELEEDCEGQWRQDCRPGQRLRKPRRCFYRSLIGKESCIGQWP